jgi:hypothetical protein
MQSIYQAHITNAFIGDQKYSSDENDVLPLYSYTLKISAAALVHAHLFYTRAARSFSK